MTFLATADLAIRSRSKFSYYNKTHAGSGSESNASIQTLTPYDRQGLPIRVATCAFLLHSVAKVTCWDKRLSCLANHSLLYPFLLFFIQCKIFCTFCKMPLTKYYDADIIHKLTETQQIWGYSSAGRALEWHSRGQRFDPAYLHHRVLKTIGFQDFFFVKTVVLPLKCHFSEPGRYTRFPRYTSS